MVLIMAGGCTTTGKTAHRAKGSKVEKAAANGMILLAAPIVLPVRLLEAIVTSPVRGNAVFVPQPLILVTEGKTVDCYARDTGMGKDYIAIRNNEVIAKYTVGGYDFVSHLNQIAPRPPQKFLATVEQFGQPAPQIYEVLDKKKGQFVAIESGRVVARYPVA
ncbi:MAG: hypothetical protein A2912_06025 [Candidatus Buchananbacteria bacterium RIFCSPLOWO2_01_FULL_40_23b]|uniref:Uncharacterized protein n=2 Tax=Candidatus Buchananiibacteriota TaxID=1817903 RepID=A0A1G1YMC7_9BACT|nr:MAG: hypothetical protein A2912_06025 [Candidatus Buchananbacteria bacterium RIFCSPLOWO2_01_FULL_40_23b]